MRPVVPLRFAKKWHKILPKSFLPSPVWHELLYGVNIMPPSKKKDSYESFLVDFLSIKISMIDYDAIAATIHSLERARLVAQGKTPAYIDGQIASIAIANDLILVTKNVKDFQHFADLKLASWP